jgi:membrane fusion protein (multidrug efflux system)
VFVVDKGVAQRREVTPGRRQPGEVELMKGVQIGERVVVDGTQNLRDGSKVNDQSMPKVKPEAKPEAGEAKSSERGS